MSKRCAITGKMPLTGNSVSHANNKTKRRQMPNLQWKRLFIPELGRSVRLRLSTKAIKSIHKTGFERYLKKNGLTMRDVL
jgi:large subunit ribosomal protein L28